MKAIKTFLFIATVITILGIISFLFPPEGVSLGEWKFYFPSWEDVLVQDTPSTSALQRINEIEENLQMQYQDSIAMIYQDSIGFYTNFFQAQPSRIYFPDNNWNYLDSLFVKLDNCKNQNEIIHILHYGDSQIEGDRITGYIRQQLQEKFGGFGPGLIPAVQAIPSLAISQSATENFERYIISGNFANQPNHRRYGTLGQVAHVSGSGRISIVARTGKNTFENVKEFSKIRIYAGNARSGFKANLILPDGKVLPHASALNQPQGLNIINWNTDQPIKKFALQISGSAEIYGIAIDGEHGVAVDNIPFRGSAGTFFTNIENSVMKSMLDDLNVGLIILEFGGNVMPYMKKEKNVEDYKAKMVKQIVYFKEMYPAAKILLIGPADMSTKINGKLQTYPFLETTVESLKEAALENGAAFWNMYEVMGGENSMISWVKNKPALAAPDYIHFTSKGAERIAELFYETLMVYYDYYNFRKAQNQLQTTN